MELTELKRVLNTGELPEYNGGKFGEWLDKKNSVGGTNLGAASTGAVGVLDMVGSIGAASKFNRTADDLLRDAGTSQSNIGGVGYTVQNGLDDKQIESEVSAENTANTVGLMGKGASTGAAIGSLAGPVGGLIGGAVGAVGGLIGGLFGGGAKKREMKRQMRLAEIKRINTNSFNQSGALTTVLQNNLALTEGNQEDQVLYAANGKPFGGKGQNAWGSNGEHKIEVDNFGNILSDVRLGTGIDNKDTVPIHVEPNTIILPNKKVELPGGLEIIPSRYYEQTGDLLGAEYATRMNIQNKKYKNGKLPGFVNGLPSWAANIILLGGAALSAARANQIKSLEISSPNTRQLLDNAARTNLMMLSRRENPYPILPNIHDMLGKKSYLARNSYGLSAAQRALYDAAGYKDAMDTMANLYTAMQRSNNDMIKDAAQHIYQQDAMLAQLDQRSSQFDYNAGNEAHGAQTLMASQADADAMGYLNQWAKGLVDMHLYRKMLNYWDEESKSRRPNDPSIPISATPKDNTMSDYISGNNKFYISDQERLFLDSALRNLYKPKTYLEKLKEEFDSAYNNINNLDFSNTGFSFAPYINTKLKRKINKRKRV